MKMMLHDRVMAIGMYEDGFPLNRFYCELFWVLLMRKMPRLYEKLREAGIPDEIWIFQWFMTFFLYNFPREYAGAFWEFIISRK